MVNKWKYLISVMMSTKDVIIAKVSLTPFRKAKLKGSYIRTASDSMVKPYKAPIHS